jgi:hypothetical protein
VSTLLATSLVIARPVLWGGGVLTYLDNPAHLAEAYSLAHDAYNGWSEVAYVGYPLGTLHSPLWYGLLAGLGRLGLPLDALYALMAWLGFVAPSLSLYAVARRRLRPAISAALAYLLLIQRPAVVGLGSALGGMWTFHLAAGSLILLADRMARPLRGGRQLAWVAGLLALSGLTHLFALVPAGVLVVYHALRAAVRRPGRLPALGGAVLLAAVASAVYWLPVLLAPEHRTFFPQHLDGRLLAARIFLPTRMIGLLVGRLDALSIPSSLYYTDALPLVLLVGGGIAGVFVRRGRDPGDGLPLSGSVLGLAVLYLVLIIGPLLQTTLLGPVSWRLIFYARVGFALGAIPLLSRLATARRRPLPRPALAALAVLAVGSGAWWGQPLAALVTPADGDEMSEVRALWSGLRARRQASWGRVYLQDTMFTAPYNRYLGMAHVLALTARETGVRQLGASYTIVPFRTGRWTSSEVGLMFGRPLQTPAHLGRMLSKMRLANATHLVTANPVLGDKLALTPPFKRLFSAGRFALLRLDGAESRWVEPTVPGVRLGPVEFRTGRIRLAVDCPPGRCELLAKTGYSPYWRLEGPPGARLRGRTDGLMALQGLPPGRHWMALTYRPPRLPLLLSGAGWLLVLGLAVGARLRPRAGPGRSRWT